MSVPDGAGFRSLLCSGQGSFTAAIIGNDFLTTRTSSEAYSSEQFLAVKEMKGREVTLFCPAGTYTADSGAFPGLCLKGGWWYCNRLNVTV